MRFLPTFFDRTHLPSLLPLGSTERNQKLVCVGNAFNRESFFVVGFDGDVMIRLADVEKQIR